MWRIKTKLGCGWFYVLIKKAGKGIFCVNVTRITPNTVKGTSKHHHILRQCRGTYFEKVPDGGKASVEIINFLTRLVGVSRPLNGVLLKWDFGNFEFKVWGQSVRTLKTFSDPRYLRRCI